MPAAGSSQSKAAVLPQKQTGVSAASTEVAGPGGCWQDQACLQQLPEPLLESILAQTDVATVCRAARTCRILHAVRLAAALLMICTRLLHRTACQGGLLLSARLELPDTVTTHLERCVACMRLPHSMQDTRTAQPQLRPWELICCTALTIYEHCAYCLQVGTSDTVWQELFLRLWPGRGLSAASRLNAHSAAALTEPHTEAQGAATQAACNVQASVISSFKQRPEPAGTGSTGEATASCLQTKAAVNRLRTGVQSPWQIALRQRAQCESSMRCPVGVSCKGAVCPVLYGYPSHDLVNLMHANKLVLAGDYLLEDQPCWACTECGHHWLKFFYD